MQPVLKDGKKADTDIDPYRLFSIAPPLAEIAYLANAQYS